ncbi:MAG TPA: TonB family protein [Candidatus Tumulicola sp.]
MKLGRRSQRLLFLAVAVSLLIHLIFALLAHGLRASRQNDVEVVTIEHRSDAMIHMATPPPKPKVTPVPHPRPSARPAPARTHGAPAPASGAGDIPARASTPTPEPAAAATPAGPSCQKSDIAPTVTALPPQPDIANAARADGTSGISLIKVQIDAQGAVTSAAVSQGTGNSSLDLVALAMARGARYSPALHECKPVAAAYTFSVKFYAW